jgi:hypothetical protein
MGPHHVTASAKARGHRVASGLVRSAQLVAGSTGWVLTDDALDKTSDGGRTWAAITPPGVAPRWIRGVFFLDTRRGWVVSARARNPGQLEISTTADRGASWSTTDLGSPAPDFADSTGVPVYIDFVGAQHGWVMSIVAASDAGYLFRTTDGGRTWQQLPRPIGGPVEFISPTTGWLTSGGQPGTRFSESFYVTRDGGRTWRTETVTPPAGFRRDQATYAIPTFTTPAHVLLAAFGNGTRSAARFYQTSDRGATWQLKATAPTTNPTGGEVSPSAAAAGPARWLAVTIDGSAIADITGDGARKILIRPAGLPSSPGTGFGDVSLTSSGTGWVLSDTNKCTGFKTGCTQTTALFATTDAGAHWSRELSRAMPG